LRLRVLGANGRDDHRIRLAICSDVAAPAIHADASFTSALREPLAQTAEELLVERAPTTACLHRYVSLFDARRGATVYSDGLAEYEATDDGRVLVTLVRAVGELSRNDLPERPGHAGWPVPTPGAQCHGVFAASFALLLHGHRDAATVDLVERTADDVLLPIAGFTLRSALSVPPATAGISLGGTGFAFSACKEAESGAGVVLRCVNLLDAPAAGVWRLGFAAEHAWRARLDETPQSELVAGSEIHFTAGPNEIVTIIVR
jgi:alpha-mannosidase